MLLNIESFELGTKQIIKLKGILDFSTVDSFNFHESIGESIIEVEVDFSELEFIDSTGIGAIISIIHMAARLKAKVYFIGMTNEIIDLFETIGVFEIKNSLLDGDDDHV